MLGRVLTGLTTAPRDLVLCSKGIERGTLKLMTEVLSETIPAAPAAVLTGPSSAGLIPTSGESRSSTELTCSHVARSSQSLPLPR